MLFKSLNISLFINKHVGETRAIIYIYDVFKNQIVEEKALKESEVITYKFNKLKQLGKVIQIFVKHKYYGTEIWIYIIR